MKNYYKVVFFGFIFSVSAPEFSGLNYTVVMPEQSRLGVIKGTVSNNICSMAALSNVAIINNAGAAGTVADSTTAFQLVPCLNYGVHYWNPLAIAMKQNPCFLATITQLQDSQLNNCLDIGQLLAADGNVATRIQQGNQYTQLMNQLNASYQFVQGQPLFDANYTTVHDQLKFLIPMSSALVPDIKSGKDFLSIPYLLFAVSFADQYVTQKSLENSAEKLFGSDIPIENYFPSDSFPITIDLTVEQPTETDGQIYEQVQGSSQYGGVLSRAQKAGYITDISTEEFLTNLSAVDPEQAQKLINLYAGTVPGLFSVPNYMGHQMLFHELFYLQLALMQPLELAAGVDNPTIKEVSSNPNKNYGINAKIPTSVIPNCQTGQEYFSLQNIYVQLYTLARYIRGMSVDKKGERPVFAPQPVDTFYGVLVLNNGMMNGQNTIVNQQYSTNQVGIIPASGGVDVWIPSGINTLSKLPYRAISLTSQVLNQQTNQYATINSLTIRVDAGINETVSDLDEKDIHSPGITLINSVNNEQKMVYQSDTIQQFFNTLPNTPWVVVVQLLNETTTLANQQSVTANTPMFTIVGLARLNPYDYPLNYQMALNGSSTDVDLNTLLTNMNNNYTALTDQIVLNSRSVLLNQIDTMNSPATQQGQVSVPAINMNLIKYNGALAYTWGANNSLQEVLDITSSVGAQYLTYNQINNGSQALTELFNQDKNNPNATNAFIPVDLQTFELLDISTVSL